MQQQVIEEIAKHLGITAADIDPSASLGEDLGIGPVELTDLLSAIAVKFKVNFEPSELEGLRTVNDIVVMVEDQSLE
ncbi:acyl carrier protein [Candidatus Daviesbacteria bacterium]|nr:acyl carrier protein [Candidatus Daviesbacteria bacterium]